MDERRPPDPRTSDNRCAACGDVADRLALSRCAICKRRVCARCLAPYGHHMLACDECRLEPW